jgi:hypothetical protein
VLGGGSIGWILKGQGRQKGGYASGTVNLSGLNWDLTEVLIGTLDADWKNGERSARLRGYGTSSMTMLENKSNGLGTISFQYRRYGTDAQIDWKVEYSIDNSVSWAQIGSDFIAPASDVVQTFSETVNIPGNVRIRIKRATETGTDNRRLNIDDIVLTDFNTINFDIAANWTAGSGEGGMTSYQTDHLYEADNWSFTGGPALRQSQNDPANQDGYPSSLGPYAWRLRDVVSTSWTATYNSRGIIKAFGFKVRRWDDNPNPDQTIQYSTDGGRNFSGSLGTINNAFLNNSSDWRVFTHTFDDPLTVGCGQFVVRISGSGGERIMIDDFGFIFEQTPPANWHYRTTASGSWHDACIWQYSTDGSGTWEDSYHIPGQTAQNITIQNGHQITIEKNTSLKNTTIQNNAELVLTSGKITLISGNQIDIQNGGLMHFAGDTIPVF